MGDIQNLQDQQAIEKLQDLFDDNQIVMLCTNLRHAPFNACPMTALEIGDDGSIWFFSTRASQHHRDLLTDPKVQLLFTDSGDQSFLSIYGHAEIIQDRDRIEELWTPMAKVWFQEGKDDPNLSVLRVRPQEGYYWDTKSGKAVSFLKMAVSFVSGKAMDDGLEGHMKMG